MFSLEWKHVSFININNNNINNNNININNNNNNNNNNNKLIRSFGLIPLTHKGGGTTIWERISI